VPLTTIVDQGSVDALADDIQGLTQIGGNTNPGDGLRTSADLLAAGHRRPAQWTVCMFTDGTTNAGESLESASKHAQDVGADRYSVIGIQDGGFTEPVALAHDGPHVVGGGSVAFARNTTEFTSLIIGTCLNDPIELVGLEANQSIQSWTNGITLIDGKRTVVQYSEAAGPTANDCSTTVSFETMPRPAVKVVGSTYESGGSEFLPGRQQRWEQGFRMESLFPVDRIDISTPR